MKLGPNMKAFLLSIRSDPGMWTAPALAKDFGVSPSSARRTLRRLEELGLIRKEEAEAPARGGRRVARWYAIWKID